MKYFTLLILSYAIDGEPLEARILTKSSPDCAVALTAADPLFEALDAEAIRCISTGMPSSSIRPKARPNE